MTVHPPQRTTPEEKQSESDETSISMSRIAKLFFVVILTAMLSNFILLIPSLISNHTKAEEENARKQQMWNDEHQRTKKAIAEGGYVGDATRILMGLEPNEENSKEQAKAVTEEN